VGSFRGSNRMPTKLNREDVAAPQGLTRNYDGGGYDWIHGIGRLVRVKEIEASDLSVVAGARCSSGAAGGSRPKSLLAVTSLLSSPDPMQS
jgi:hypothetical protein